MWQRSHIGRYRVNITNQKNVNGLQVDQLYISRLHWWYKMNLSTLQE